MAKRVPIYPEDAVRVTANYEDFDGDISKWRDTFYELWRYQMTWSFAYELAVREGRNGVFVDLLVRPAYRSNILNTMSELGYGNINSYDVKVAVVESYDLYDIDIDIDSVVTD